MGGDTTTGHDHKRQTDLLIVTEVPVESTYDLRRRVLRDGRHDVDITFPEDARAGTFHLAVSDGEQVIAVGSFNPSPTPLRPGVDAYQLRGMAVDDTRQGSGVGRMLLQAAEERLRAAGISVAWANARDSALGFYETLGWRAHGEGFCHGYRNLPHHVVVRDLGEHSPEP
jgi:GNAT superfamily N-acetyltransferase